MKKFLISLLLITSVIQPLCARNALSEHQKNTEALYRQAPGSDDGGYAAISLSMLGWGIGLVGGIALVAALTHQSRAK